MVRTKQEMIIKETGGVGSGNVVSLGTEVVAAMHDGDSRGAEEALYRRHRRERERNRETIENVQTVLMVAVATLVSFMLILILTPIGYYVPFGVALFSIIALIGAVIIAGIVRIMLENVSYEKDMKRAGQRAAVREIMFRMRRMPTMSAKSNKMPRRHSRRH